MFVLDRRRIFAFGLLAMAGLLSLYLLREMNNEGDSGFRLPEEGRSLLLVTVDTTRPDRLEPYGASDIATPNLLKLANDGALFENAVSVAPITLVAHTSMMTGLYPFHHGVRNNGTQYVPPEVTTLAETLQQQGYSTGAFISAAVLDRRYGLDQGFDYYDDDLSTGRERQPRMVADRPAGAVVDSAIDWIDQLDPDQKFFAWVHLYDPHARYFPPSPYREQYSSRLYDGEIAYMDAELGRLLEHQRIVGVADKDQAVVSVIGDHGESLGEHGESTHAILAYDSTLLIPWLLKVPGAPAGQRIVQSVGQVDLAPTLLSALGYRTAPDLPGRSLLPLVFGTADDSVVDETPYYSETYLPYYTYGWERLRTYRAGRWKYIDAPREELYDLKRDPRELSNLAGDTEGVTHDLRRDLEELLATVEDADVEADLELDTESAEKLRSLGYLAVSSKQFEREQRPDPKDLVHLHVELERARTLLQSELFEVAASALRSLLEQDPENLSAMMELVAALDALGRIDEAIAVAEEAQRLDPEPQRTYIMLAKLEAMRGDLPKALALSEIAFDKDPRYPSAVIQRATLLMSAGERDQAEALVFAALADNPDQPILNYAAASMFDLPAGRSAEGELKLQQAIAADPFHVGAWLQLGKLFERTDRSDEAVEAYRAGLDRQAADGPLLAALGVLLAHRGELDSAEVSLRDAIRLSRSPRPTLYLELGEVLSQLGRVEEAQEQYEIVIRQQPENPSARNNLAVALLRAGQFEQAREVLQGLVSDYPTMADAHNNLAAVAVELGEWDRVEVNARRAVEVEPNLAEAWNNLGLAKGNTGRSTEALEAFERALAVAPDYWQARFNLADLLTSTDSARAVEEYQQVISDRPDLGLPHLRLGEIYAELLNDPARARASFERYLELTEGGEERAWVTRRIATLEAP